LVQPIALWIARCRRSSLTNWADFTRGADDEESLDKLEAVLTGRKTFGYRGPAVWLRTRSAGMPSAGKDPVDWTGASDGCGYRGALESEDVERACFGGPKIRSPPRLDWLPDADVDFDPARGCGTIYLYKRTARLDRSELEREVASALYDS